MTSTTVSFSNKAVTPPVFLAGSFTDWQIIELEFTQTEDGEYLYSKTFTITPGEHQYKLRLGSGDWWTCDEAVPRAFDASGNENNILKVEAKSAEAVGSVDTADTTATKGAHENTQAASKDNSPVANKEVHSQSTRDSIDITCITSTANSKTDEAVTNSKPDVISEKRNETAVEKKTEHDSIVVPQTRPVEKAEQPVSKGVILGLDGTTDNDIEMTKPRTAKQNDSAPKAEQSSAVETGDTISNVVQPLPVAPASPPPTETTTKVDMSAWKSADKPPPVKSSMKQPGSRHVPVWYTPPDPRTESTPAAAVPKGKEPSFFSRLFCGSRNIAVAALIVSVPVYLSWLWSE